jgi:alpha-galactosidase
MHWIPGPSPTSLRFQSGSRLFVFGPDRAVLDGRTVEGRIEDLSQTADGLRWTCRIGEALLDHIASSDGKRLVLTSTLRNPSDRDLRIGDLDLFGAVESTESDAESIWDRAWVSAQGLLGDEGIVVGDREFMSFGYFGMTGSDGATSALFGFTDVSEAFYFFLGRRLPGDNGYRLVPRCRLEGIRFAAGRSLDLSPLVVTCGEEGLSLHLDRYAADVAARMGTRVALRKEPETGWCSWYWYYGREDERDVLENVRLLAESPLAERLHVIQLDDGWNLPSNEHPRVWGDWEPGAKFSRGMRAVVNDIHEAGFRAGLWLAPFTATVDSRLYREHPDWFVGSTENSMMRLPDFGLDLTHPDALEFLRTTFLRVFDEWGFDYVKLDFILYGAMDGKRYDDTVTSAQAYRRGLELIRGIAGDRFVLGCGAPILQSAGLVDAMRLGADTGARWAMPINIPAWPYGNCAVMPTAVAAFYRAFLGGVLWQNDPDCIVVRGFGNEHERKMFGNNFIGHEMVEADYGLSANEAAFWAETLRMTGVMLLLSEKWDELPADRKALVMRCFERPAGPVHLVDWHPVPEVVLLQEEGVDGEVGFFNMTDDEIRVVLPLARLKAGLKGTSADRLSGMSRETVVPARTARIRRSSELLG